MQQTTAPTLSVATLAKLVKTLPSHELSQIDVATLPPHVPPEALRGAPLKNREILHDLLVELEARRMHEHVEDLHYYGKFLEESPDLLSPVLRERLEDAKSIPATAYLAALNARKFIYANLGQLLDEYDAVLCLARPGVLPEPGGH